MKIAIVLGRGTEGCGNTMCAVQMQKVTGADIFSTIDKKWPRAKGINFPVTEFKMAKDWEKYAKIINEYDLCVIYSVPSVTHPEACQENFVKFLQNIKTRKVLINVDHKAQSISRNANMVQIAEMMDVMMTHSLENAFCTYMQKNGVKTPIVKMGLGFDYDDHRAKYWKPINEQQHNLTRWIGRTTGWKGPELMMEFHESELMKKGFITVLEGLEASISYTSILYRDKEKTDRRKVVNYFRPEKEHGEVKWDESYHGQEVVNQGSYLYPPYVNVDAMERMSKSAFGSDLYHLGAEYYGNNIENCHAEIVACGAIPIFHKHFLDHVVHKVQGKPISQCINTGTIGLDYDNFTESCDIMVKLKNDPVMRDEWREMAFEFWKQHSNGKEVVEEILKLAFAEMSEVKQPIGLEGLFE